MIANSRKHERRSREPAQGVVVEVIDDFQVARGGQFANVALQRVEIGDQVVHGVPSSFGGGSRAQFARIGDTCGNLSV
ncbi:hypothetical protein [Steroidobacter agaridevorans]|uniref:hypothetical protein n=1 Tax=Steroidobacter agaridevorans TaxID=2695856 RepID=UPI001FCB7554|nr:hypothetical protein [Steroidobacter agaridevorans]